MKKVIALLFAGLLACTTVFFVGCNEEKEMINVEHNSNVIERPMPSAPSVGVTFGATRTVETEEVTYIEKEINVEVRPSKADKRIAFSLTWQDENNTEDVSQYAEIIHSSPEDQTAYLRVYKSFDDDVIVLKVNSVLFPDKFAECELHYVGFVDDISILNVSCDGVTYALENSSVFGDYYHLYSGTVTNGENPEEVSPKNYHFKFLLSNILGSVGRSDIEYEVKSSTGLYIGDFQVVGGNGGAFSNVRYVTEDELFNMMLDVFLWDTTIDWDFDLKLKYSYDDMLSNPLTPYFNNELHPLEADDNGSVFYRNIIIFGSGDDLISGNVSDDGLDMAKANEEAMKNFYFILTLKDTVTGVSEDIKIVISPSVSDIEVTDKVEI